MPQNHQPTKRRSPNAGSFKPGHVATPISRPCYQDPARPEWHDKVIALAASGVLTADIYRALPSPSAGSVANLYRHLKTHKARAAIKNERDRLASGRETVDTAPTSNASKDQVALVALDLARRAMDLLERGAPRSPEELQVLREILSGAGGVSHGLQQAHNGLYQDRLGPRQPTVGQNGLNQAQGGADAVDAERVSEVAAAPGPEQPAQSGADDSTDATKAESGSNARRPATVSAWSRLAKNGAGDGDQKTITNARNRIPDLQAPETPDLLSKLREAGDAQEDPDEVAVRAARAAERQKEVNRLAGIPDLST